MGIVYRIDFRLRLCSRVNIFCEYFIGIFTISMIEITSFKLNENPLKFITDNFHFKL